MAQWYDTSGAVNQYTANATQLAGVAQRAAEARARAMQESSTAMSNTLLGLTKIGGDYMQAQGDQDKANALLKPIGDQATAINAGSSGEASANRNRLLDIELGKMGGVDNLTSDAAYINMVEKARANVEQNPEYLTAGKQLETNRILHNQYGKEGIGAILSAANMAKNGLVENPAEARQLLADIDRVGATHRGYKAEQRADDSALIQKTEHDAKMTDIQNKRDAYELASKFTNADGTFNISGFTKAAEGMKGNVYIQQLISEGHKSNLTTKEIEARLNVSQAQIDKFNTEKNDRIINDSIAMRRVLDTKVEETKGSSVRDFQEKGDKNYDNLLAGTEKISAEKAIVDRIRGYNERNPNANTFDKNKNMHSILKGLPEAEKKRLLGMSNLSVQELDKITAAKQLALVSSLPTEERVLSGRTKETTVLKSFDEYFNSLPEAIRNMPGAATLAYKQYSGLAKEHTDARIKAAEKMADRLDKRELIQYTAMVRRETDILSQGLNSEKNKTELELLRARIKKLEDETNN